MSHGCGVRLHHTNVANDGGNDNEIKNEKQKGLTKINN